MREPVPGRFVRIVAIGPECTGKTSLAARLAGHLGVPWSREFAREFVERHPRPVDYADVDTIARGQVAAEDAVCAEARAAGLRCVIHDTDLVSTVVYSAHYFGDCPAWVSEAAAARVGDLYLLHEIDVPWQADGFQREAPERRAELMDRFRRTLAALGARTVSVAGGWDARFEIAAAACAPFVVR